MHVGQRTRKGTWDGGKAGLAKGTEGETAEGAPWVGMWLPGMREARGNRRGKARLAFSPRYYQHPT